MSRKKRIKIVEAGFKPLPMPIAYTSQSCGDAVVNIVSKTQRHRELWAELHQKEDADDAWLQEWIRRVPCGDCRRSFRLVIDRIPPRFDDWQRWTWEVHNAVNAKLGKPEFAWDEYAQRWLDR